MMDLITVDMETFYDKEYSLSRLTTEEYVRDPRFQVIGVGVKKNDQRTEWFSGTHGQLREFLAQYDWANSGVLAHNTMFDGAIMSWRLGIKPKVWFDTLCMARAIHGVEHSVSLKALAERYGVGVKGTEVLDAKGKRRADFSAEELANYGGYCVNDVELTYAIFNQMIRAFPKVELKLIDLTLRMFTEPVLELDAARLEAHLKNVTEHKAQLLDAAGVTDKKDLMSNAKFAAALQGVGVEPPTKISPTTGKTTYAFAKGDEAFMELLENDDVRVQVLANARIGNKSTLEETRTQRFLDISGRGLLPIPLRYCGALSHRWAGSDKINLQNLPSRGPNAKQIKNSITAPSGYVLIDADSAQIEARVLAWLAEQEDVVVTFRNKEDVYRKMASKIYGKPVEDITKPERQIGKVVILGAGYGVGHHKLQAFLKMQAGVVVDLDEAKRIIDIYRASNHKIAQLWRDAGDALRHMSTGYSPTLGRAGVLDVQPDRIIMPSGIPIVYADLKAVQGEKGPEYSYAGRNGRTYIYGGKLVENLCQSLARDIIGAQMLRIAKRHRVVLTVHDSVVSCVREEEASEAQAYIEECMRWTPDWADGLPVNCESEVGKRYGGDTE